MYKYILLFSPLSLRLQHHLQERSMHMPRVRMRVQVRRSSEKSPVPQLNETLWNHQSIKIELLEIKLSVLFWCSMKWWTVETMKRDDVWVHLVVNFLSIYAMYAILLFQIHSNNQNSVDGGYVIFLFVKLHPATTVCNFHSQHWQKSSNIRYNHSSNYDCNPTKLCMVNQKHSLHLTYLRSRGCAIL